MTTSEKIAEKREKIKKAKERISTEQTKINKLTREIEELESFEVKGLLKELSLPLSEVKTLIRELKEKNKLPMNEDKQPDNE